MRRPPPWIVFSLFFLSGATGLVYEVLWLRQLILIFGSTLYATSSILSTFMFLPSKALISVRVIPAGLL